MTHDLIVLQTPIESTNQTVGSLISFTGSVTSHLYPQFFVPQPVAARRAKVTIKGQPLNCSAAGNPKMRVVFLEDMTGLEPNPDVYAKFGVYPGKGGT